MCSDKPKEWLKWLPLAEYWYNTSFHSAIQSTPYQVLYGQPPPIHLPYLPGSSSLDAVDRSLTTREQALHLLKHHLAAAQNRMKQQADKHRSERNFNLGDWVYVKLQPYRQHSLKNHHCHKLAPRYFGPFQVIAKVGVVAYTLKLPPSAKIHNTFHVSLLKKKIGPMLVSPTIPSEVNAQGQILVEPVAILDRRLTKRGNQAATQVLVHWSNSFPEDATWEFLFDLQKRFPEVARLL